MNKIKKSTLLVVSLSATLAGFSAASAQNAAVDVDQFLLADTDGSGCVDWEELRNRGAIIFDVLDDNNDGIISGDEHLEAVTVDGEEVRPDSVDITRFQVSLRISFDRGDEDGDGCLDREEWDGS